MLIKEYRILMPLTVDEYRIAQLYMIQKKSREESDGADSGVEILKNEPYNDGPGGSGQYTQKVYHVGRHLPNWFTSLMPKSALSVEEEAWNAYPYTKTRYNLPIIKQFSLEIETYYFNDDGRQDNVFKLTNDEKKKRIVDFMDIVNDPLDCIDSENPLKWQSEVTGRGPLTPDWREVHYDSQSNRDIFYSKGGTKISRDGKVHFQLMPKRIMCAYKLCRVEFPYWGIQSKCEQFIHDVALRKTMIKAHRQAWTWQDEWFGLTMAEIRELEVEAARELQKKLSKKKHSSASQKNDTQDLTLSQIQKIREPIEERPSIWSQYEQLAIVRSRSPSIEESEDDDNISFVSCLSSFADEGQDSYHQQNSNESNKGNVLIFVIHGGSLYDHVGDPASKTADLTTLKSLMNNKFESHYPMLRGKVHIQLVPCQAIVGDILEDLAKLNPCAKMDVNHDTSWETQLIHNFVPIGTIPILLVASKKFPKAVNSLQKSLNLAYRNFLDSREGRNFQGPIHLIADAQGSIFLLELLLIDSQQKLDFESQNSHDKKIPFHVQDVFLLGSPVGILLEYHKQIYSEESEFKLNE